MGFIEGGGYGRGRSFLEHMNEECRTQNVECADLDSIPANGVTGAFLSAAQKGTERGCVVAAPVAGFSAHREILRTAHPYRAGSE